MIKSKQPLSRYLMLVMLLSYLLSGTIFSCIYGLLRLCDIKVIHFGFFWPVTIILLSCGIISAIFTNYQIKKTSKSIDSIKGTIKKIADGKIDDDTRIDIDDPFFFNLKEDLNKMIDELNSIAILRNDFINNFSHEFKTPIVSIKGFAEILYENKNLTEQEKKKYLSVIKEESERLATLAESTLLLSKLDSEKIIIEKEKVYVNKQIEECVLQLYDRMKKKNITVEINLPLIETYGSKALLKEVWINIITNAIKYNKKDGKIEIKYYEENNYHHIIIKDTGIGIEANKINEIFNEYFQADKSRHDNGIGLGLSISKKIVSLHKGNITAKSIKDEGTVFDIALLKI